MYAKIGQSREAVVQFLRSANPEDEFFLIGVADRPELLVDFTNSVEAIQNGISKATPDGETALLDAVYIGLDTMRQARYERKTLLDAAALSRSAGRCPLEAKLRAMRSSLMAERITAATTLRKFGQY
jgi:hypothetical protein